MKLVVSIAVAIVMPFGLFVLAGIIVNRMLANHRQTRALALPFDLPAPDRALR